MKTLPLIILTTAWSLILIAGEDFAGFTILDKNGLPGIPEDYYEPTHGTATCPFYSPGLVINDWNELPPGIFGSVYAIVIFNGSVYVAGNFLAAGNVVGADYIARWDGCQWYAEAPGMTGPIYEMVFIGGDIYVGGEFSDAGDNPDADGIAVWDGTQWNSLGPGLNGSVFAIAGNNTNEVYAGGVFADAGGNPDAHRIAKWNGSSWIPLGTGLDDTPYSIAIQGGQVFVGGIFTDAGGNPEADYIAQWDGSSWQDVGGGLNGWMWNMVVSGPDIYMIGSFTQAGGNSNANFIARWTGTEWQNVGDYFQSSYYVTINAITIADDYLYVGVSDEFGMAWVMQCDMQNENWTEHPLYYPDSAPIGAIAVDDNDIYVGNIQTEWEDQGGGDGGGCWGGGGFTHHHGSSRGNGGILRWGEVVEQIIIEGVPGSVCQNENPFSLPTIQSGYPGNWSGPGVSGNTFDPENVEGWLLLTFTPDQSPCPLPVSIDILVEMTVINLVIPTVICGTDPSIQLNEIQSGIPGSWSGTGVNNNQFDPSGLSGVITLTFTPYSDQCAEITTGTIEVVDLITPVISGVPESICESSNPINLDIVQDGIPGNWSGQGVNSNVFNPTGLDGTITLTFSPATGTCIESATTDIVVDDAIIPLISGVPGSLCQTDNAIPLPEIQSGMNGNWSGPGITNNIFNPVGLNGTITISFTPDPGQCALPAETFITVIICSNPPYSCEIPGYTFGGNYEGHSYYVSDANATWNEANALAISIGGHLATISNSGENSFVAGVAALSNDPQEDAPGAWIGLTDEVVEGTFVWVNGEPLIYTNWEAGEPNDLGGEEDHTEIYTFDPVYGTWNDLPEWVDYLEYVVEFETVTCECNDPLDAGDDNSITVCNDTSPFDLTEELGGNPDPGGTWSPTMASGGNIYDPAIDGSGSFTYTVSSSDCPSDAANVTIAVIVSFTPIISGVPSTICESNNPLSLPTIQDGITGNWSGLGVFANTFDPSGQSDNVTIMFSPDDGQCATAASHTINIEEVIIPIISGIPSTLCENNDPIILPVWQNGITGQWSGPGISNNTFYPDNFNGPVLFVFTPNANQCASNATFEIIVDPAILPEITGVPSEMCGANFPVVLNTNQNGITGSWSGPGVMNNVFDPTNLNGTISLTFTPNNPCATIATADINVLPALIPIAVGIPGTLCQTDESFLLPEMLQQITGNWSGPGVSNNNFNPEYQNGSITLTFTPENWQCAIPITTSIVVSAATVPIITGIPTSLCQTDSELILPEIINGITGNWSGQNVTMNAFIPEGLNGNYTLQFSPDEGQCAQEASTEITIHTSPTFINLNADCDSTSHTYTVSFDIIEGDPSSYTVNGVPVSGTHFISPPISSGNTEYQFTLNDVNGCGLVQIQGNLDCTCATFAGTMNFPVAPVKVCEGSDFSVVFNGDAKLDPDDVLGFVLHDQAGTQLGTVYAISDSYAFTYPSGIVLGQVYYVSPIAGSNDGLGNINLLDPCLSVSQGVPVIFYRPEVSVSGGGNICPTECITYTIVFSGEKPFELLFQINADGALTDRTLTTDLDQVELTICPADYGLTDGILDIIPMSMSDANCTVSLSSVPGSHATVRPVSTVFISDIICPGQTFEFNGTVYDQDHPSGIQTLQTTEGCDSIIEINLSFYEPALHAIQQTLCLGGSMMVNGTEYNEFHPAGTEVILGGSINGCDSSITVQLDFNSVVFSNLSITLCPGESMFINGNTYDASNPVGSELFPGASVSGCDSVVNIQLSYFPFAESAITQKLCKGEWITVNGTVYDENHASGFEVLPNASIYGCDSVVNIQLSFFPTSELEITQTLCKGGWLVVNGTIYDETHLSGVEVMPNASELGCDSTILVDLSFYPEALGYVMDTLDVGKSIVINGTEYNQSNPTGIEVIPGGSVMGCDSIITIALYFHHALAATVQTTAPLCHGEFTGEIIVEEIAGGLPPYLIFIDGGSQWTVDVLPAVLPGLSAGMYKLIIMDGLSATIEFDLVVPETPELIIDAGIDLQIEKGKDVPLNVKASFLIANWLWSPVDFLSCTDCPDPVAVRPDRDIVYSVIATDEKGCQASDDIQLIILPDDELYVPTVFSPNGDGVNDTWRIYSSDQETQLISLSILDRWGSIIFNRSDRLLNDSDVEWDGYMKGSEIGTGVYVFVATVKTGDKVSKHIKGDITLIR